MAKGSMSAMGMLRQLTPDTQDVTRITDIILNLIVGREFDSERVPPQFGMSSGYEAHCRNLDLMAESITER